MKHSITFEQLPNAVSRLFLEVREIKELLAQQSKSPAQNKWLNLQELCEYLPEKPAKATVYTWVSNGIIPYHKKGKKLTFLQSDIEDWLKAGRKKTHSEIAAESTINVNPKN